MTTAILILLRWYFRILARVAPRTAGRHAYRLFSTPRKRASIPPPVADVMARAERFDVQVDGYRVAAYRWGARDETKGAPLVRREPAPRVMLVHGWESRAARLAVWVDPLLTAGFEVVAFDAPAHGESTGRRVNPPAFVDSIRAVVERVGPLSACVGHSLGGYASLLAVSGGQLSGRAGVEVERLVILAGAESGVDPMGMFCDILGLTEGIPRKGSIGSFLPLLLDGAAEFAGRPVTDYDVHRLFGDYPVPTLWLHDPEDDEVPFEGAERVARVCPHVTLERIDGLGHHHIARDPSIIRRGLAYLAHLARGSEAA